MNTERFNHRELPLGCHYHLQIWFGSPRATAKTADTIIPFNIIYFNNNRISGKETTGLPSRENNDKIRIAELCITVVESELIRRSVVNLETGTNKLPRVRNKLSLCINPGENLTDRATGTNNLTNEILANQTSFSPNVVNIINEFLNAQRKPICFVANYGIRFDYPILKAEINRANGELDKDILCVDSVPFFRSRSNGESCALRKLYERLTDQKPVNSYLAEGYVEYLIHCAIHYGDDFVEWANRNAKLFSTIEPLI